LKKAQLKIGELKSQKDDLQQKVYTLTAEVTALRGQSKSRKKASTAIPYPDDLKNLGKKFAMMEEPWLKPSVFSIPLVINPSTSPAARFVDDESYDQGTITVLHEFVPVKYHEDMINLSGFAKDVSLIILNIVLFTYVLNSDSSACT
jgi:hypothetical protein